MTKSTVYRSCAWLLLGTVVMAIAIAERADGYAEPSIIQRSWQFDFAHRAPRLIQVKSPGEDAARWYWYLPYTVTNHSGGDRLWVPRFTVYTDRGHVIEAGKGVSPVVFKAIAAELDNRLLESPVQVIGRLLQGKDNARDSVAIWPAPATDVNQMTLFVGGLSGETQAIVDPATGNKVIVRKTLMLEFATPGDHAHLAVKPVQTKGKRWVMR